MARKDLLKLFEKDKAENGAAIEESIRTHRMGDLSLTITDENGNHLNMFNFNGTGKEAGAQ